MAAVYAPSAIYQPLDRIAVFVIGYDDGYLYDNYWNGWQWVWEGQGTPPGGNARYASAAYQPTLDRISVFITGDPWDGHLYDIFWNGSQWQWEDQGMAPYENSCVCTAERYLSADTRPVLRFREPILLSR
jgi:hypothetical protein